jgi:hypothetical protein
MFLHNGVNVTPKGKEIMTVMERNKRGIPNAVNIMSGRKQGKMLKGGMTSETWRKYFTEIFLPNLAPAQKPALLIIDGHASHIDLEFMLRCKAQGVDVVQEPANCSSVCQALDQVCFSVLKKAWREEMILLHNVMTDNGRKRNRAHFTKWHVPYAMKRPWEKAMTRENIQASFRRSGLDPLDVRRPLARIAKPGTSI